MRRDRETDPLLPCIVFGVMAAALPLWAIVWQAAAAPDWWVGVLIGLFLGLLLGRAERSQPEEAPATKRRAR